VPGASTYRLIASIGCAGPQGEPAADGQLEVASAAATLGAVPSEALHRHTAMREPGA
jgi:hypothetical protein